MFCIAISRGFAPKGKQDENLSPSVFVSAKMQSSAHRFEFAARCSSRGVLLRIRDKRNSICKIRITLSTSALGPLERQIRTRECNKLFKYTMCVMCKRFVFRTIGNSIDRNLLNVSFCFVPSCNKHWNRSKRIENNGTWPFYIDITLHET